MTAQVIFGIGEEFLHHDRLSESIEPWEDGLRAPTGPGFFEWWYFDAHLADGSTVVIVYYTKPFVARGKDLRPLAMITYTAPDGKKQIEMSGCAPQDFYASTEGCDVRIGKNTVTGDLHSYRVHVECQTLSADLTFTGTVPPWRPGNGKNYYDPDLTRYFGWLPSIPFGTCAGTLTRNGETVTVEGSGYHDHNWGNVSLNRVMSHWYWGRASVGEYNVIFVEMVADKAFGGQKIPVFLLAKDGEIITGDSRPLTLQTNDFVKHSSGRQYPRELDFHWASGVDSIHLRLRKPELIEAASLLGFLPGWQQKLARLFANPYYFRFNAPLELEINLRGERVRREGNALYEMMLLQ